MGYISYHITPLDINSLGPQTHEHIHAHTDMHTETILRNQACAWFKMLISQFLMFYQLLRKCMLLIIVQTIIMMLVFPWFTKRQCRYKISYTMCKLSQYKYIASVSICKG